MSKIIPREHLRTSPNYKRMKHTINYVYRACIQNYQNFIRGVRFNCMAWPRAVDLMLILLYYVNLIGEVKLRSIDSRR